MQRRCWTLTIVVAAAVKGAFSALSDPILVWHDEFSGDTLDGEKWTYQNGDGCDYNICGWGNDELQWYKSENVAVAKGSLSITLHKEEYASKGYTSGKIITQRKASVRYGRVEARIKSPQPADGLWPAFWMLPANNTYGVWAASGEIDIFESSGSMTAVQNNLFFNASYPNVAQLSDLGNKCSHAADLATDFHVYAVEWSPTEFNWYMDDELICTQSSWFAVDGFTGKKMAQPAPFDQDFYIILNLALGGTLGGATIGKDVDGSALLVDYVRVYQERSSASPPPSFYTLLPLGTGTTGGQMVWNDEFDGSALNTTTWTVASGKVCLGDQSLCSAEEQTYSASNAQISDGILSLSVDVGSGGKTYSSAMVTSAAMAQQYGRFEASIKLPTSSALAPAMWLLPQDAAASYGQIDVVVGPANDTLAGIRYGKSSAPTVLTCDAPVLTAAVGSADGDFHVWAVEWNDERLRWYVDGLPFCEQVKAGQSSWPFSGNFTLGLGLAVGRNAKGTAVSESALGSLESELPQAMEVDYVRIYQATDRLPAPESAYITDGYKIWWDEFDGSSLNTALWRAEFGNGCGTVAGCGNGNLEAQFYRPENTMVQNGNLVMTAKLETYASNIFTSAKVTTLDLVSFKRGRYESRIKLPYGQGLWPAFWMMPLENKYGNWSASGEIDIMENRNYMQKSLGQLHFGGTYPANDDLTRYQGGGLCYQELADGMGSFSDGFHVFAVEWEENAFRWYLDGRLFCERSYWYAKDAKGKYYPYPAPFDQNFYLLFTLAVGGVFTGGTIDTTIFPQSMYIDYVRIYSMDPNDIMMHEPAKTVNVVAIAVSISVVFGVLAGFGVYRWRQGKIAKNAMLVKALRKGSANALGLHEVEVRRMNGDNFAEVEAPFTRPPSNQSSSAASAGRVGEISGNRSASPSPVNSPVTRRHVKPAPTLPPTL